VLACWPCRWLAPRLAKQLRGWINNGLVGAVVLGQAAEDDGKEWHRMAASLLQLCAQVGVPCAVWLLTPAVAEHRCWGTLARQPDIDMNAASDKTVIFTRLPVDLEPAAQHARKVKKFADAIASAKVARLQFWLDGGA